METFRGDTLKFDFTANLEGEPYQFKVGDLLKIGLKDRLSSSKYVLYQEIKITEATETVPIIFSHKDMMKCSEGEKILEVELTDTDGIVTTLYQEKIKVIGDVINE